MTLGIASVPLSMPPLVADAMRGAPPVSWYAPRPRDPSDWRSRAADARAGISTTEWLRVLAPAFEASGAAAERLDAAAESGFVVTTGQQPGLFGGPFYTLWKALTALELADALQQTIQAPVAPVFWAATDDSDFDEAAAAVLLMNESAVQIKAPAHGADGVPLADVPLPDLARQIDALAKACGSAAVAGTLQLARDAYSRPSTVGGAYVKLMRAVLEPFGVAVLDAAHSATRAAMRPLLRRALECAPEIEAALAQRTAEIKRSGYSPQVKHVKGRSLVFQLHQGARQRIRVSDTRHLAEGASNDPLTPNVLLRPIAETSILPTLAYVGGPGEIAYFAQTTAAAMALRRALPLIVPRWSGFILDQRTRSTLAHYRLEITDFSDPHALENRYAREAIPDVLKSAIADLRTSSTAITRRFQPNELVSPSVLQGFTHSITHRIDRLERRIAAAVKRRGNDALRDIAAARATLFPLGRPQERVLSFLPFLVRYGDDLVKPAQNEIRRHAQGLV